LLEECLILLILQVVEFIEIFVVEAVFMRPSLRFNQSFLDYRLWVRWLLRNDAMFAEYVIPVIVSTMPFFLIEWFKLQTILYPHWDCPQGHSLACP
jgi:hypothetical protein